MHLMKEKERVTQAAVNESPCCNPEPAENRSLVLQSQRPKSTFFSRTRQVLQDTAPNHLSTSILHNPGTVNGSQQGKAARGSQRDAPAAPEAAVHDAHARPTVPGSSTRAPGARTRREPSPSPGIPPPPSLRPHPSFPAVSAPLGAVFPSDLRELGPEWDEGWALTSQPRAHPRVADFGVLVGAPWPSAPRQLLPFPRQRRLFQRSCPRPPGPASETKRRRSPDIPPPVPGPRVLDCGIHPGLEGMDALPYIDLIDPAEIDLLLISHFHLDHCGALPWFLQKTSFKGRTFMTHATKAIYRWLLSDYVKVSNISADDMLYTETDLEESMDKIETINFHEVKEVAGIKFWCYHAGHVLGAAMFMIEIAGVKLLYTGDFSRQEDRHLMAAEIPNIKPDILIIESTYGTHIHEKREEREARFCNTVHDIVNRGGRGLIPVFALGRAQELLLILDEYWQNHPELHDIPIYYASSLAKKCMAVYQTYVNAMNDKIRKQININNPFVFKHISNLKSMDHFDDIGPSVVMASPGMMQSGLSRELFESWCTDKRNGVIIAGYCVEGTLAKHIMSEPEEITTMSGQKLPLKMSVDYISFSAHTDYQQTSEFIRALKPPHVILVHGEQNEMARLKAALIREYEDNDEVHIEVHNPRNTEAVTLNFRGEKLAKVMGFLADKKPEQGQRVSGILVKRNFNYHILSPCDLSNYTDLAMSTVKQTQAIPYTGPL
ncbi:hypothetical protein H8959_013275 [Pygathrix nigripes]